MRKRLQENHFEGSKNTSEGHRHGEGPTLEEIINDIHDQSDFKIKEHDTGKLWIDNKRIFSVVLPFNNVVNATLETIGNIPNVENYIKMEGIWRQASKIVHMGFSTVAENISITVNPANGDIRLQPQAMDSTNSGHVIVEYTKV